MDLEVLVTAGLGDNSYVLAGDGEAVAVDPQRDVRRYLALIEERGLALTHVLETHVHNDYVSGALELAAATGAEVAGPAGAGYAFPHRPLAEGDELRLGDLRIVAVETPGHTPEHTTYLVYEPGADAPTAAFTGGSLMVGGAGRTDLLGDGVREELTRSQYWSLRRLAGLPDTVQVLPTHGAGSFCGVGEAPEERLSTMAEERIRNPALAAPDEESFVRQQLSGLRAFPHYYRHMAPINRAGPAPLGGMPRPPALGPAEVEARMRAGVWLVDGRRRRSFAEGHVPGSLNVELRDDFGSYVGWLVPFGDPLVLVVPEPEERRLEEAVVQLVRIGYDRIEGFLEGGVEAWRASGRPVRSYPVATIEDLCREVRDGSEPVILDVRQRVEWDAGHIPGSRHAFVGDLPGRLDDVAGGSGEVWTICASGHRSSMASSLLDRAGVPTRLVAARGVPDWLALCRDGS